MSAKCSTRTVRTYLMNAIVMCNVRTYVAICQSNVFPYLVHLKTGASDQVAPMLIIKILFCDISFYNEFYSIFYMD